MFYVIYNLHILYIVRIIYLIYNMYLGSSDFNEIVINYTE